VSQFHWLILCQLAVIHQEVLPGYLPAYTFFAPRRSASSASALPMPRLAPVIKTFEPQLGGSESLKFQNMKKLISNVR
jgi:hypothetical protein